MYVKHNGMSSTKIITANQAHYANQYKNSKMKALKCCANIYFNGQRIEQDLTPNYTK